MFNIHIIGYIKKKVKKIKLSEKTIIIVLTNKIV